MTHGPEHHIEHAEHAAHASHDDFNKRVTMSIAIVAAILAAVTMLGHRAHNETLILQGQALQIQGEALRIQGEAMQLQNDAGRESTNAAKHWQYYQAKNLHYLEAGITLDQLKVLAIAPKGEDDLKSLRAKYQAIVDKNEKRLPEMVKEGHAIEKKAEDLIEKSGKKLAESQVKMQDSQKKMDESHHVHDKANRFDYGELGLQFGVVLCSLAILTKGKGFWFAGLVSSIVGLLVALTGQFGLFLGHH